MSRLSCLLWVALALTACAPPAPKPPPLAPPSERADLTRALLLLGPGVDEQEARQLTVTAYAYPRELARDYGRKLSVLAERRGVAFDFKTPALCRDWAERFEARLRQERFRTLEVQLVISPARALAPVEHSAVVATVPGQPVKTGILLDPCRDEGALYWTAAGKDGLFDWRPRLEVLLEQSWGRRPWYGRNPLDGRILRPDPLTP
ncbi:hypothetical protein [Salipiger abyssi]|uniref:Peptidase C39-like domain-containing protein n=1 Tax=Salipiger abyssi TaxID=1250539 RepID=A0A1P8UQR0_9RHOB|nr:hypothetical protein [Salipiger abyssi]APZ51735.1 hypothetical protein Ga0080574_TMP1401 [Salipiger abyssi]